MHGDSFGIQQEDMEGNRRPRFCLNSRTPKTADVNGSNVQVDKSVAEQKVYRFWLEIVSEEEDDGRHVTVEA